ncbi:MAG: hypothetical protein IJ093_03310 [Bacilli bacterium]|nr:hypothetical protein [Bacilli bacterium]
MDKKYLPLIILLFLLALSLLGRNIQAKYINNSANDDTAKVALMASDTIIDITSPLLSEPGSTDIVPFVITNKSENKVCEVAQTYKFTIDRSNNIPFEYQLCKDSNCTETISETNGYYTDANFKFDAGVEQSAQYYLKITWPENQNDASYALEVDYIRVKVEIIQIN